MKKFLSIVTVLALLFSMAAGFTTVVSAAEEGYAWVLVDTHEYPVPEADSFYGSLKAVPYTHLTLPTISPV